MAKHSFYTQWSLWLRDPPDNPGRAFRRVHEEYGKLRQIAEDALDACEIEHDYKKAAMILREYLGDHFEYRNREDESIRRKRFREKEYSWEKGPLPPTCPDCGYLMKQSAIQSSLVWRCENDHPMIAFRREGEELN